MEDGTGFLEKLDEQSIFWGNILDPGNQQSARRLMAFAGLLTMKRIRCGRYAL
jgi:hypothetical protein